MTLISDFFFSRERKSLPLFIVRFVIKSEILHSDCVSYKDKSDFGLGSDDQLDRLAVLVRLVEMHSFAAFFVANPFYSSNV